MVEVLVHADGLTRAYLEATADRPVPHLVVTCGDSQLEFTPGQDIAGLGDLRLATVAGASVIARASADWRDRLCRLAQAGSVLGERFRP